MLNAGRKGETYDSRSDLTALSTKDAAKKIQIKNYSCHELTMKSLRKQQMNQFFLKEHDVFFLFCHTCFDVTHIFVNSKCIYVIIARLA